MYYFNQSLKLIFLACLFLVSPSLSVSQTYNIADYDLVQGCSGMFYDSGGPNGNFLNKTDQITFLPGSPGQKVSVTFNYIDLNNGLLRVYNGRDAFENNIIASIRSDNPPATPATITSRAEDGSLTFLFTSTNYSGGGRGWEAQVRCDYQPENHIALASGIFRTCGAKFYDSGGPNGNYIKGNDIITTIMPDQPGHKVSVTFNYIELPSTHDLVVYNGAEIAFNYTNEIAHLRGEISGGTITSTAEDGSLTFVFNASGLPPLRGWDADISCTPPPNDGIALASGHITGCSGKFYDSGGPNESYIIGNNTVTTIFPENPGEKVTLTFNYIELDYPNYIQIFNGSEVDNNQELVKLDGEIKMENVSVTSSADDGSLTFRLSTGNGGIVHRADSRGWDADISCQQPENLYFFGSGGYLTCGQKFYDSGGPNGNYMSGHDGKVTIFPSEPGKMVKVEFKAIDFAYGARLTVFNGPTDNPNNELDRLDYLDQALKIYTSTAEDGSLTFVYRAFGNQVAGGWEADVSCEDPPFFATAVEVNQAVQPRIFDLSFPGNFDFIDNDLSVRENVPIVPNKPTLIRFYLAGLVNSIPEATGQLVLNTYKNNTFQETYTIEPNVAGLGSAKDVELYTSEEITRKNTQLQQRVDLSRTLNFVIPPEYLAMNIDKIEFVLVKNEINKSSIVSLDLNSPVELGINYRKITKAARVITDLSIRENLSGYVKAVFPVSKVRDHHIILPINLNVGKKNLNDSDLMYLLIGQILLEKGISSTPFYSNLGYNLSFGRYYSLNPIKTVYGGIVDDNAFQGKQSGYGLTPQTKAQSKVLFNKVFVSKNNGPSVAHEIGHNLGLCHAGSAHGEAGRGCINYTFSENNGDPNGTLYLDTNDTRIGDFGIAFEYRNTNQEWTAYLINPCPEIDMNENPFQCLGGILDSEVNPRPFDIMSYASAPRFNTQEYQGSDGIERHDFPFAPPESSPKRWISSKNYKAIYHSIKDNILPDNGRKISANDSVSSGIFISGLIDTEGVKDVNVYQGFLSKEIIEEEEVQDEYLLMSLFNESSQLIYQNTIPLFQVADASTTSSAFSTFAESIPAFHKIQLRDTQGIIIYDQIVSTSAPSTELMGPIGGENISGESYFLRFNSTDLDNDTVSHLITYSPDLGRNWLPVGYIKDTLLNEIEIDISWLPPSDSAIFKIASSDGLRPSVAITPQTFCLRTNGECNPIDVAIDEEGNIVTGIDIQKPKIGLSVIPNPFKDQAEVTLTLDQTSEVEITLLDMLGREVQMVSATSVLTKGTHSFKVEGQALKSGVYILNVSTDKGNGVRRIVKW